MPNIPFQRCCQDYCAELKPIAYRGNPSHKISLTLPDYNDFSPLGGGSGEIFPSINYDNSLDNAYSYKVTGDSKNVYHCVGWGGVHKYSLESFYSTNQLTKSGAYNFRAPMGEEPRTFEYADRFSGDKKTGLLGRSDNYRYGYEPTPFNGSYDCQSVSTDSETFLVVAEGVGGISVYDVSSGARVSATLDNKIVKVVTAVRASGKIVIFAGTATYSKPTPGPCEHGCSDMAGPPPWNKFAPSLGWGCVFGDDDCEGYNYPYQYGYAVDSTDGFDSIGEYAGGETYVLAFDPSTRELSSVLLQIDSGVQEVTGISVSRKAIARSEAPFNGDCIYIHGANSPSSGTTKGYSVFYHYNEDGDFECSELPDPSMGAFASDSAAVLGGEIARNNLYIARYWDGNMGAQAISDASGGLAIFKENNTGIGKIRFGKIGGNNSDYDLGLNGAEVSLSGGSGVGAKATITVELGEVKSLQFTNRGAGYLEGDLLGIGDGGATYEVSSLIIPSSHEVGKWEEGGFYLFKTLDSWYYRQNMYYYYNYNYIENKIDVYSSCFTNNMLVLSMYEGGLLVLCGTSMDGDDDPENMGEALGQSEFDSTVPNTSVHFLPSLSFGRMNSLFIIDSWSDGKTIFSADCLQSSVLGGPRRLGLYDYPDMQNPTEGSPESEDLTRAYLYENVDEGSPGGLMASQLIFDSPKNRFST